MNRSDTRCRAGTTRRPAFTLMELLVVIAVMMALAGLLFPVVARIREEARRVTCLSNLRQISMAHQLYLQDCDDQFVYWYLPATQRPKPFGSHRFWTEFLRPYFKSDALLRDPSAPSPGKGESWLTDYALPTWGPGGMGSPDQPHYFWPGPPLSLGHVARPSQTIQVSDGWTTTIGVTIDAWSEPRPGHSSGYRHRRGSNLAFLDGHARWMSAEEVKQVDSDERGVYLRHGAADR